MKKTLWPLLLALALPAGVALADGGECDGCRVSLRPLDLSQPPSDAELILSGQLGGALSPTLDKKSSTPVDRLLFGRAMEAWNRHEYGKAIPLFKRHLREHGDSPWRGEAQLHLGCDARFNGRYTEAETYFRAILDGHGGRADGGDDIACKARLRLAMLEFMRGDFDNAESLWAEMVQVDQDRLRRDHARHWLMRASLYRTEAKWVRRCAVESVAHLLTAVGRKAEADSLWNVPANADYGFRADELAALSAARGVPLVGVQVATAADLPIPFIAHYRFNHFVTVTGRAADGTLEVFDSILNHAVPMTPEQFAVEWSGLALVPKAAWNATVTVNTATLLAANELRRFTGGCCGVENPNRDKGCNTGGKQGGTLNSGTKARMPVWAFTPISMNLFVKDTPIGYQPAVGPEIAFTMAYNSIDSDVNLPSFGPKWFFAYHCRAIETPAATNGSVTVYMPDGRDDVYSPVPGSTNAYTPPARVFNKLLKVSANHYTMETPEGTLYTFGAPQGATNVSQALLSTICDRHGNAVTLVYNGQADPKLSSVVDAMSRTSRIYYATSGLITNIVDPFGRHASFTYNSSNYLATATDMGGVSADYTFYQTGDASGYLKSLRTTAGVVSFAYVFQQPGGGNTWRRQQITATYPNGSTEVLYYNGGEDGNPSTFFTDRDGHTTRIKFGLNPVFPNQGSIVYEQAPDGSQVNYQYNAALQPTNVTDEAGQAWSFAYNDIGRLTSLADPGGYRATLAYTNGGADLASVTEGTDLFLSLAYTANRDVAAVTNALGQSSRFAYDPQGRLTNAVDAILTECTFEYGTDGRLSAVRRAGLLLGTWQYDAAGRATNAVGPDGVAVAAAFDNLDRLTALTLPGQAPYAWTYQTNSFLVSRFADRAGRRTSFAYDTLNRLVSVQAPDSSHTAFQYDANDNLLTLIDAEVHRTRFAYDTRNRVTAKTYPGGKSNQVAWTTRSLPATFTSPRGVTTAYGFNPAGLLTNVAYTGTTNTSGLRFAYDSLNRVTNAVDGWATNVFLYDALGRLVQAREIQGTFTQTLTYVFDAAGRTTNVTWQAGTNAAVSTVYSHDALDRITNVTSDAGRFGYAYVSNGPAAATLTYPNGETANYAHDGLLRLTNLLYRTAGGAADGSWVYGYNAADQVTNRVDPAGNPYAFQYDQAGRLIAATASTNVPGYPFFYRHDFAGNRTRQAEGTRQRTLAVNVDNQLVDVGRSNQANVVGYVNKPGTGTVVQATSDSMTNWVRVPTRFVSTNQAWFDASGVVVTNAGANNTIWIRATDKFGNTVTQVVHVTSGATNAVFAYDADGNLTNRAGMALEWDAENRPVRFGYGDGSQTRLRYDGVGRLREVTEYGPDGALTNATRYAWNGWLPVAELDGDNGLRRTFTWGLDVSGSVGGAGGIGGLVGINDAVAGTNYQVRTDGKGNVTEVRGGDGTVVAAYQYAPFGALLASSGSYSQPFRFQSKLWHDGSGLGYWGRRWYDAAAGRWISRDGLGEAGGINLYEYCGGDAIGGLDPFGQWNIWNVGTWGVPNGGDVSWGHSLNPFDETAVMGPTLKAGVRGFAAWADGVIPFSDPFQGFYADSCGNVPSEFKASQFMGGVSRDALLIAGGSGLASRSSSTLARNQWFGKGSRLFGRGGRFGEKGSMNQGPVRTGWGWKQTGSNPGRDVFRTSWSQQGNRSYWNHLDWF